MAVDKEHEVLQRYRRDRRVLLDFILSGDLIKNVVMPPAAVSLDDVDLDEVDVDYIVNCAKKGDMLELSKAISDYHEGAGLLDVNSSASADDFFLVTNTEASGSPPRRPPPAVPVSNSLSGLHNVLRSEDVDEKTLSNSEPLIEKTFSNPVSPSEKSLSNAPYLNSSPAKELTVDDIEDVEDNNDLEGVDKDQMISRSAPNDASDVALMLPPFTTGIIDDDLRETAYEILLACAGSSGGLTVLSKQTKKHKKSKFLRKIGRSLSEAQTSPSHRTSGLSGLLETMRAQMEISESMDTRSRHGLLNAVQGKVGKKLDKLLIPLELLCCISPTEFPVQKTYSRWQKRQLNMLEEGLINHPAVALAEHGHKATEMMILLAKIEESEALPEIQKSEYLRSLRDIAIHLAERPDLDDSTGEVCHWADGYHLNVRLYEKLLMSIFDVLDEGKLIKEVEEILELLKSTWHVLGVTETIHHICYAWVLFHQFFVTKDKGLLKIAVEQLKRTPLKEQRGPQDRLKLQSWQSNVEGEGSSQNISFLEAFLTPIHKWADNQLRNYHMSFAEDSEMMEDVVTVAMVSRQLLREEPISENSVVYLAMQSTVSEQDQIELYISTSIKDAFSRTFQSVDHVSEDSEEAHEHSLSALAEETKKLLRRETTLFVPILSKWHPQATFVSVSLLHNLYGIKLKPFLADVEHLTEEARSVLAAAYSIEQYVMSLLTSAYGEDAAEANFEQLARYEIETFSRPFVKRWVDSQLERLLAWVERALQQEKWDPISPQQRHGSSIVEVYRIVDETVEQFFALGVPMTSEELNGLVHGIGNAFQVYANLTIANLGSKEEMIPPVPPMTRYKKEAGFKAFVKKERSDRKATERMKHKDIVVLATPILLLQLNTLHYAVSHLTNLEDSLSDQWLKKKSERCMDERSKSFSQRITLDGSRKDLNAAIDKICEYTGVKIVFVDLREPFIDNLYRPSVSLCRLDALTDSLDMALSELCGIIVEPLRDQIVTSLLQACVDGLIRVLLDGGPSRVFSPSDAHMLEEDLEILQDFFVSDGEGLPSDVVENLVSHLRRIIKLLGHESRELIDDLRSSDGTQGSKFDADVKTLQKILCHRNEPDTSQFLKKQYKIPKSSA